MRGATLGAGGASPLVRNRELRMFEVALVVSIVLHVLAFAALQRVTPRPEPAAAIPGPISARLVELAAPAPRDTPPPARPAVPSAESVATPERAAAPEPAPVPASTARLETNLKPEPKPARRVEPAPAPKIEPKRSPRQDPKPRAKPRPRPQPRPETKAGAATKTVVEPVPDQTAPSVAPSVAAVSPQPSGAAAGSASGPLAGNAPAVDEDLVARYRLQLIGAARRYKRYPRAAMDNQWEGAAEVAMVIGANGRILEMTISSSSGHEVLDQQAIDMFRKAKPLVPIPAALRGREFRVTLKAIYSLRDPGA
jgi:protein TonB